MKAFARLCALALLSSLWAARFAEASAAGATIRNGEYRGTASVTIQFCDLDASGKVSCKERKTFKRPVTVMVDKPKKCGAAREKNLFHLSIYTDQDPADPQDGEFWLYSSGTTRALWSGCTMLQYWDLKLKDNLLTGSLTDTHAAEGVMPNRLWAAVVVPGGTEMVWPYPFDEGASLRGTITNKEVKLRIEGGSTDSTRPFMINLTARRVE